MNTISNVIGPIMEAFDDKNSKMGIGWSNYLYIETKSQMVKYKNVFVYWPDEVPYKEIEKEMAHLMPNNSQFCYVDSRGDMHLFQMQFFGEINTE